MTLMVAAARIAATRRIIFTTPPRPFSLIGHYLEVPHIFPAIRVSGKIRRKTGTGMDKGLPGAKLIEVAGEGVPAFNA